MSAVFLKLLNMSISASWLVLAVIVLRLCLKKAPKAIHCALWALVAIRLLCPFSLESGLSLVPQEVADGDLISEWTDAYVGETWMIHDNSADFDAAVSAGREPISMGEGHYYVVTGSDRISAPPTVETEIIPVLSGVWLAGAAALLLYAAVSYLRIRSRVKVSLNLKDNIWRSEQVDSPFILGFFRPKIYLPFGMDDAQMHHVIAHEQAHLRRRDHWWKPLGFILLAVYWFNPLMWVAYILLCRDIELACDEKVIRDMGTQDKKAYSEALLACSVPRRMIAACPLAFGEVGVKKRIASVLHYKKPAFWILAVALLASAVVAVCFMTNPKDAFEGYYHIEGYGSSNDSEYYIVVNDGVELKCTKEQYEQVAALMEQFRTGELEDIPIYVKYKQFLLSHKRGTVMELEIPKETTSDLPSVLSLDDVIALSSKGSRLSWSDFENYAYTETGSGLYIRAYEIDDRYSLYIGGAGPDSEPMYIYLWSNFTVTSHMIDIRTEDVEAYISQQEQLEAEYLKHNDPLPDAFPIGMVFSSGAGAWGTNLTLYPDGSFTGSFSDSDMGDSGEDYPRGTHYYSEFFGQFDTIKQIDSNSWALTLADLYTTTSEGETRIEDGVRYIASAPYGLEDGKEFILYAPGTPTEHLTEEFLSWWPNAYLWRQGELDQLDCYGLYNLDAGYGFFSAGSESSLPEAATDPKGREVLYKSDEVLITVPAKYAHLVKMDDLYSDNMYTVVANLYYKPEYSQHEAYVHQLNGGWMLTVQTTWPDAASNVISTSPKDEWHNTCWSQDKSRIYQELRPAEGYYNCSSANLAEFKAVMDSIQVEYIGLEPYEEPVAEVVPAVHSAAALDAAAVTVENYLLAQYRNNPNTHSMDILYLESDPAESAQAAVRYFQRTDALAVEDPARAAQMIAVKAVYFQDWLLDTQSNAKDAGTHAKYFYLLPHESDPGRWHIHDQVTTSIPSGINSPGDSSSASMFLTIELKSLGASADAAIAQLNGESLSAGAVTNSQSVSIYNRAGEEPVLYLVTKDGRLGELPLPYADDTLRRAQAKNTHLDLNYRIYYYEAEVENTVLDPDTGTVRSRAGKYRYLVDLADFTCAEFFIPTKEFSAEEVNFSGRALTTVQDEISYEERLAWAQSGPDYEESYTSLGQYAEGDGCLAFLAQWVGTPHVGSYTFEFRFPDGTKAYLPLPREGYWASALPDTMAFQNGKFIYETTFPTQEVADEGRTLIHLKGTYHYEVDIAAKTVSLTVLQ